LVGLVGNADNGVENVIVMTRRIRALAALGLFVSIAAACESSSSDSTTTTAAPESDVAEAAPFHAVPADPVVVTGTVTCSFSDEGVDPEGGAGFLVVCELDMSDPRVSGTETHDRLRFFSGGGIGDVWVAEAAVITNAEGTWIGSVQAADDGTPSGEAHYVGEGSYAGLEFHYYFGGSDSAATSIVRGWISSGG
jgi:hypothetical protein